MQEFPKIKSLDQWSKLRENSASAIRESQHHIMAIAVASNISGYIKPNSFNGIDLVCIETRWENTIRVKLSIACY